SRPEGFESWWRRQNRPLPAARPVAAGVRAGWPARPRAARLPTGRWVALDSSWLPPDRSTDAMRATGWVLGGGAPRDQRRAARAVSPNGAPSTGAGESAGVWPAPAAGGRPVPA